VVVAGVIYYLLRRRQGRPAFGEFGNITLLERIAQALNWPLHDVESLSLPSLRELVRPVDRYLAEEISESINYHQDLTRRSREKPFRVGRRSGNFGSAYSGLLAQIEDTKQDLKDCRRQHSNTKPGSLAARNLEARCRKLTIGLEWLKREALGSQKWKRGGGFGDGERYKTFIRSASASHWGRKRTVDTGLSYNEARRACQAYNANRSSREIKRGTKMEFTQD
jgi:hypothetical protein